MVNIITWDHLFLLYFFVSSPSYAQALSHLTFKLYVDLFMIAAKPYVDMFMIAAKLYIDLFMTAAKLCRFVHDSS